MVVAYGTDGLSVASKPLLENFCRELSQAGYVAALPHYFEITGTVPGFASVGAALTSANLALWTKALVESVKWCEVNQGNDRVGLVGFSLGGYMSARTAIAVPVKGLVDFFGPMTSFGLQPFPAGEEFNPLKANKLPQTQIHHGKHDFVVPTSESTTLLSWFTLAGRTDCELFADYDCGHPQDPEARPWTVAEQVVATPRVLTFLTGI
ncbi:MAG: dienelactone hydrolase family protein [Planctomycetaceae bacterium]|nr:dienelactone hydrolase family protein [Planctomycetaceae bacterium]